MMELNVGLLKKIGEKYGESFYILDLKQFRNNFIELRNEFQKIYKKTNIAYSYKTNYIPQLCQIVNELGGYAEVVSDMEYDIAIKVGVLPEHIAFNGPYKNSKRLENCLFDGVNINVDSIYEMEFIKQIAKKHPEHIFKIGIRCNYDIGDGVLSRFGFDIESDEFLKALSIIKETSNLQLKGMHSHFASRNIETWPTRTKLMLDLVQNNCDQVPQYICQGGGIFGKMEESLKLQFESSIPNYKEYAEAVCPIYKEVFGKLAEDIQPTLFIEPGSALVGDCMKFACKVVSIKNIRGKSIATLLGSIYNINPTLNKKNPPIKIYHMGKYKTKEYVDLDFGGFTCIESDYLYKGFNGELAVGDYVVFSNIGSYSIVLKPPFILPNFAVVEIDGDEELELIKDKETFDDLFHTFHF